jgi:two-component system cell cycle sensor histidine kinase/response regulator CckA
MIVVVEDRSDNVKASETNTMASSAPEITIGTPARILIVEDEGIIAGHIASRLLKIGYSVAGIAESSEEAIATVRELAPDLILMDIRIKGSMDGIETAAALRETFDIPVVYLTAHTDQQTIDRAKLTGAFGFLTKPIHHTSLATTIEMAIHKHRADRETRHQRAWMATVLGTMADAMIVIDLDREIQYLNRPAEELTGWANADARGRDIAMILPLRDSESSAEANDVLFPPSSPRTPSPMRQGLPAGKRSGKWFPVEGDLAPSIDGGRVVGAVITFRDATRRQAQEIERRQQSKMQAVGRLAAGITHDFNNLLFIILGYTEEMLHSSSLSDHDMGALNEIRKAGENAAHITQQLLKFTRRDPVEKVDVNLNDVIRSSEEHFRRLGGNSVRWQFRLGQDLRVVRADPGQLKQVLMNLVANARDAMPDGGKVTIETVNVNGPGGASAPDSRETFVGLSVSDTGDGMDSKTAEHMFEPFYTTKERGSGTGLGLSIVHSIVTDLGGTINVESEPGKGATFTIYIPVAEAAAGAQAARGPGPRQDPAHTTVLLIEDRRDRRAIRHMVGGYFADSGYKVLTAESREEAVHVAEENECPLDLLITDVTLPGASGFEIARALAAKLPKIKTIFITDHPRKELERPQNLPEGALFLSKPFCREDFLKAVSDLVGLETRQTTRSSG